MHGLLETSGLSRSKRWGSIREQNICGGGAELEDCKTGHQLWLPVIFLLLLSRMAQMRILGKEECLFSHKLALLLAFAFIPFEFFFEPCKASR